MGCYVLPRMFGALARLLGLLLMLPSSLVSGLRPAHPFLTLHLLD